MPGGDPEAYKFLEPVWNAIAAKVDRKTGRPLLGAAPGKPVKGGVPCNTYIGPDGAGHYVKMVHNGIEYGDMQLICEAYQMMKALGLTNKEMHQVLINWNKGDMDSYLIEITRDILGFKDEKGEEVVDFILDTAGQKGTGKWTAVAALDEGQPLTLIGEAVFARCLSAVKDERVAASKVLAGPCCKKIEGDRAAIVEDISKALYASKIVSYAQGYQLMRAAAKTYGWNLNYGGIALMWRGGCIIRSRFLGKIKEAFDKDTNLVNLLLDSYFTKAVADCQCAWRNTVKRAIDMGVPTPAFSSALAYYDGYRSERLPANLLQAQRDYFGAHTYERTDKPRGEFFHTNWTGRGGNITATTYTA